MPTQPSIGRLYYNGKPFRPDDYWPIQVNRKKDMIQCGYNPEKIEIHAPVYPGVTYCKSCSRIAVKPRTYLYDYHEFWRCECKQINFIN